MFYHCKDCLNRYPASHSYWIRKTGYYICVDCLYKYRPIEEFDSVVVCENKPMDTYILEGTNFRKSRNAMEWAKYMETASTDPYHRHVGRDFFYINDVEYCNLSTVFLGIDHNYANSGVPILFESMIFGGGDLDESMERYPTWETAASGHLQICARITKRINSLHKIDSLEIKEEDKLCNHYFRLLVKGHVKFTADDLRLIREN